MLWNEKRGWALLTTHPYKMKIIMKKEQKNVKSVVYTPKNVCYKYFHHLKMHSPYTKNIKLKFQLTERRDHCG
jgi:hypothetical protein